MEESSIADYPALAAIEEEKRPGDCQGHYQMGYR